MQGGDDTASGGTPPPEAAAAASVSDLAGQLFSLGLGGKQETTTDSASTADTAGVVGTGTASTAASASPASAATAAPEGGQPATSAAGGQPHDRATAVPAAGLTSPPLAAEPGASGQPQGTHHGIADAARSAGSGVAASEGSASGARGRVAGLDGPLQALRELVGWPRMYGWEGRQLGVRWPRGLLLHGPPGCGKTLLVSAVAEEYGAVVHTVTAADVFGAYVGESERRMREVFEAARADAKAGKIAIVFLDEADALCPARDGRRQHEARVVAQLLTLLDGADTQARQPGPAPGASPGPSARHGEDQGQQQGAGGGHLVVVAATNRPNALDPALRRPGRLDREVLVTVPDAAGREDILRLHTRGLTLSPDLSLPELALSCHGYSGADLAALAREAAMHALSAVAKHLMGGPWQGAGSGAGSAGGAGGGGLGAAAASAAASGVEAVGEAAPAPAAGIVTAADFAAAMRRVGPSIVRGAEVEVEPVRWEDVGGLPDVKLRLRQAVEWPLLHRDAFSRLGLTPPRGVLLFGPPGCSKTTLARAAATASRATLLPLSCAQLYSMYVGEGEALLRDTFKRARLAAPAIVFLDEVDALAARRSESEASQSSSSLRLLSALLTEMDGMELATGVLVLAATNRPAAIDAALMRPGRLDVQLYVPPPDLQGRLEVLRVHTAGMPLAGDVDLEALAADTAGFSGAELAGICREAAIAALREDLHGATHVAARHFAAARGSKRPSLTPEVLKPYEELVAARGRVMR